MVTAKAAALPRLITSPRVSVEPRSSSSSVTSATGSPSFRLDSLAKCASCKAFDEAVEEGVVEQRERDRRDQHRRHERLPEEDVAAYQVVRDACRDRSLLGARYEGERVDELVHAEREGEDDDRKDPWEGDRED